MSRRPWKWSPGACAFWVCWILAWFFVFEPPHGFVEWGGFVFGLLFGWSLITIVWRHRV